MGFYLNKITRNFQKHASRDNAVDKIDFNNLIEVMSEHVTIHWFKKGLRLHDNAALLHAVTASKKVYPVYIWDEDFIIGNELLGEKRIQFLFRCLKDLQKNLQSVGSNLYIFKGDTETILKEKVKEWKITQVSARDVVSGLNNVNGRFRAYSEKLFCKEHFGYKYATMTREIDEYFIAFR